MNRPTTDRGWAGFAARMFKTVKPYRHGGNGLSGNRRFEAAFEGGYEGHPANADEVVRRLFEMVKTDRELAECVDVHDRADGSGIVGLADAARASLAASREAVTA